MLVEIITSFIEVICFLTLISGCLLKNTIIKNRLYLLVSFILLKTIYFYLPLPVEDEFISFIYNFAILIFTTKLYFNLNIKNCAQCIIFSYILMVLIQFPFMILDALVLHIPNLNVLAISCMIYSILVAILTTRFLPIHKLYNLIFHKPTIGAILSTNIAALLIIITMYSKIDRLRFVDIILFFAVALIILISVNIVAITQLSTIQKQKKQLVAYEEYLPLVESLINSVRRRQHHHANEIQSIMSLMYTNKDYDSLVDAINKHLEFSKQLDSPAYLLKLNLKLVAGFLFTKEQEALRQNKKLDINVLTFHINTTVPEYILVELFGILIDNALEAVCEGETVYVTLNCIGGKVIFKTQNKGSNVTNEMIQNMFSSGYSTKNTAGKKNLHSGLGLPTLRNIVIDQFKGDIIVGNEDNADNHIFFEIHI